MQSIVAHLIFVPRWSMAEQLESFSDEPAPLQGSRKA